MRDWLKRPTDFAFIGVRPQEAYLMVIDELHLANEGEDEHPSAPHDPGLSPVEMRVWLEMSPPGRYQHRLVQESRGYDEVSQRCGLLALAHYEAHPGDIFCTEDWLWKMLGPQVIEMFDVFVPSLFQWGWAINAARYTLGWPEMPSPAFISGGEGKLALAVVARDDYDAFLKRLSQ